MELYTLGKTQIRNQSTKHYRVVEFLALLTRYPSGLPKKLIENLLFRGYVCNSTVPTLASRCRALGVSVDFICSNSTYRLPDPIEADFVYLEEAIKTKDWKTIWNLYKGEFLPRSRSPYALSERERLTNRLVCLLVQTKDKEILTHAVTFFSGEQRLWQCLAELGDNSAQIMCSALDRYESGGPYANKKQEVDIAINLKQASKANRQLQSANLHI